MTLYLLYTKGQPELEALKRLADQLQHEPVLIKLLEADSPEGVAQAEVYDMFARPGVILAADDGSVIESWTEVPRYEDLLSHIALR